MKGYTKYFLRKIRWYLLTFLVAIILNFLLPRLTPGNPISTIVSRVTVGMTDITAVQKIYEEYNEMFGLDKSIPEQFVKFVGNMFKGDLGTSFQYFPRKVSDLIGTAVGWTLALQLPAILVGWFLGNGLGCLAAYIRKGFDKVLLPVFLFISNLPAFGMAILLLFAFAVELKWFPTSGGYGYDMTPNLSWDFISSVLHHYQLPFWSVVLTMIGGQAIGMRSMAIYELNSDYVKYSRFLGIKDRTITKYVFRNAVLPQVTGLAMSLGTMVGGALVAEMIFSYPGLGTRMLQGITSNDYPMISGCTLIITIGVLIANLAVELLYGVIDPRVKAAQEE